MRRSYREFYDSLDTIAPLKQNKWYSSRSRVFFGEHFTSKKAIVEFVKKFPQLEDAIDNYQQEYDADPDKYRCDMALVLYISAIKNADYEYADKIRHSARKHGVEISRFKGNIFMRTP